MTLTREALLRSTGWFPLTTCQCENCRDYRDAISKPGSIYLYGGDIADALAAVCVRLPGHDGPCNGLPRMLDDGKTLCYQAKPEPKYDVAYGACATSPGIDQKSDGTNPKDLLGVLKLPLRLFPPPALAFGAKVFALGAKKYGPFNWRSNKVKLTVYLEAAMRHILSKADGEDVDPESGLPHEAHAMACMAIILDAMATGNLVDDRYKAGVFGKLVQSMQDKKVA